MMKFDFSKKYNRNTLGGVLIHLAVAFGILLLLAVVYFYVYLPSATNHNVTITVPNVEGMNIEEAAKFLADHDLRYEINDSSYSSEYPALAVLKQVPAADAKVKQNRKIYLSINRINPPTVPLPDLIDGSLINAEAVLKGSELRRGRVELVDGPFFHVVKQMKVNGHVAAPGHRVPKGTVVDLVAMNGGKTSGSTPDVLGLSYSDAEFTIRGYYLSVEIHGDTTGAVVIKQNPLPGETIQVGDVVEVWMAKPGEPAEDEDEDAVDEDAGEDDNQ